MLTGRATTIDQGPAAARRFLRRNGGACAVLVAVALRAGAAAAAADGTPTVAAAREMVAATAPATVERVPAAPADGGASSVETSLARALATIVDEEVTAGRIGGAVVLVGRDDRVVFEQAFGARAVLPVREPMTTDTVFDAASLTKVVATTPAILQLVDAGRLGLDDPVARYWPEFGAAGKGAITVRQLLAHTAGLRPDLDDPEALPDVGTALVRIAAERPFAAPGSTVRYSDLGFAVLGELVRRVSGESLDRYATAHVFGPLGMATTAFLPPPAWRPRIAPTVREHGAWLRGVVHDPTARRMGGVAGHAGLFTTARDLARFAAMMLGGGTRGPTRVLSGASVVTMTSSQGEDGSGLRRGLGWELAGPRAAGGGGAFSARAFGHTGYTGTSLWIDPATHVYAIVLTNRVHPADRGDVRPLRQRVATVVAAYGTRMAQAGAGDGGPSTIADGLPTRAPAAGGARGAIGVAPGIDVLEAEQFGALRGRRIGLITNHSGRDTAGRRTIDVLHEAPGVRLTAIFTPEHGLDGTADAFVASGRDPRLGIPVHSLYGGIKRPTPAMLADVDALVFDVQDVGVRFYTYVTTMAYAMEAAAARKIPFFVLDRPNPIGASTVQGPVLERDLRSFAGYFALPVRYGLTIGELATLLNVENAIGADLHVVRMRGYARGGWYDDTGLAWVAPSPNLRSLRQATLYPGVALVEGANVSVGRGTATPFEVVGAPWIDGGRLAATLNARALAGLRFEPTRFTPSQAPYRGKACGGVRIVLDDRERLDAPALGVELASALHRLYPGRFTLDATVGMVGARWVVRAIAAGDDPRTIVARWQPEVAAFAAVRERFLLY